MQTTDTQILFISLSEHCSFTWWGQPNLQMNVLHCLNLTQTELSSLTCPRSDQENSRLPHSYNQLFSSQLTRCHPTRNYWLPDTTFYT